MSLSLSLSEKQREGGGGLAAAQCRRDDSLAPASRLALRSESARAPFTYEIEMKKRPATQLKTGAERGSRHQRLGCHSSSQSPRHHSTPCRPPTDTVLIPTSPHAFC